MYGFLVFNERNSIVFYHCDDDLSRKLAIDQLDFCPDCPSSTSGFCSEQGSQESIKREEASVRKSLDAVALTELFLPLVVLWKAKAEFDGDTYRKILLPNSFLFEFFHLRDQHVILFIYLDDSDVPWRRRKYSDLVVSLLNFCFGPMLYSLSNSGISGDRLRLDTSKRQFDKLLEDVDATVFGNGPIGETSLQLDTDSVYVGEFCHPNHSAISHYMAGLAREFQVFMGVSVCLLVSEHSLIAINTNSSDFDKLPPSSSAASTETSTLFRSRDLLFLLRSCPSASQSSKCTSPRPKYRQFWMEDPAYRTGRSDLSQRLPWDIYRLEISPGAHFVCLGRSVATDVVPKISFVLSCFEVLEIHAANIAKVVEISDSLIAEICRALTDMIPEDFGHVTVETIRNNWLKLRKTFASVLNQPSVPMFPGQTHFLFKSPVFAPYIGEIELQMKNLRRRLRDLMIQLVAKSQDSSMKYKLGLFEKCWSNRLSSSKFCQNQTKNLLALVPSRKLETIPPAALGMDCLGYVFLLPNRRICFVHLPEEVAAKQQLRNDTLRLKSQTSQSACALVQAPRLYPDSDEYRSILITNRYRFSDGKMLGLVEMGSRTLRSVLGKFRRQAVGEESGIPEPFWCLALFDSFTNRQLAAEQTGRLAALLYQKTVTSVKWNFE